MIKLRRQCVALSLGLLLFVGCSPGDEVNPAAKRANEALLSDIPHYPQAKEVSKVTKRGYDKEERCTDTTEAKFGVSSDVDQSLIVDHYRAVFQEKGWTHGQGHPGGSDAGKYFIVSFFSVDKSVTVTTEGFTDSGEYTLSVDAGIPC